MIALLRQRGVKWALLGIVAYIAFLIVNLPAAWLGATIERSSGGKVALGDSGGTVWNGHGALAVRTLAGYRRLVDLRWRVRPLKVFIGRLSFVFSGESPDARLNSEIELSPGKLTFVNMEADAPADSFEQVLPALVLAKPDGQVRVQAARMEVGASALRGTATIEWTGGGLAGLHSPRLGDYRLQVTGNGDSAALQLVTLRGDLRLNAQGEVRMRAPRSVQLRGVAQLSPDRKDLEALLPLLRAQGSGTSRPFAWTLPF